MGSKLWHSPVYCALRRGENNIVNWLSMATSAWAAAGARVHRGPQPDPMLALVTLALALAGTGAAPHMPLHMHALKIQPWNRFSGTNVVWTRARNQDLQICVSHQLPSGLRICWLPSLRSGEACGRVGGLAGWPQGKGTPVAGFISELKPARAPWLQVLSVEV